MKKTTLFVIILVLFVTLSVACNNGGGELNESEEDAIAAAVFDLPVSTPEIFAETVTETAESFIEPEPEPEFLSVRVCAVGDNLIHQPIYSQADRRAGVHGDNIYDFSPAYELVSELIASYDLAIINQETLICNDIYPPSSWPRFNSPVALGDFMIEMGFAVFGIANNHTLDKGTEGLTACLDYWRSREAENNIIAVGAYYDADDRSNIRVMEINGVTFSFLSYTEHLNGLVLPADSPLEIGDSKDLNTMVDEIARAKQVSDVCVVMLHWGVEDYDRIEPYQREAAARMAEAGADIILGTHPHVLRDIEYIERENGERTVAAYSLANFISAQDKPQTMIGGVLSLEVVVHRETRAVEIKDVFLIPTITHYDAGYGFVRIYPLSEYTPELAALHGVRQFGEFSYDYIYKILENSVSGEFLDL